MRHMNSSATSPDRSEAGLANAWIELGVTDGGKNEAYFCRWRNRFAMSGRRSSNKAQNFFCLCDRRTRIDANIHFDLSGSRQFESVSEGVCLRLEQKITCIETSGDDHIFIT